MKQGKAAKSVYIYLVPKNKFPKDSFKASTEYGSCDMDNKTGKLLGYEFINAVSVEIDGKKV